MSLVCSAEAPRSAECKLINVAKTPHSRRKFLCPLIQLCKCFKLGCLAFGYAGWLIIFLRHEEDFGVQKGRIFKYLFIKNSLTFIVMMNFKRDGQPKYSTLFEFMSVKVFFSKSSSPCTAKRISLETSNANFHENCHH